MDFEERAWRAEAKVAELEKFVSEWSSRFGFLAYKNAKNSIESIDEVACLLNEKRMELESELSTLRAFKKKHDEDIKILQGSVTEKRVAGYPVHGVGCVVNELYEGPTESRECDCWQMTEDGEPDKKCTSCNGRGSYNAN